VATQKTARAVDSFRGSFDWFVGLPPNQELIERKRLAVQSWLLLHYKIPREPSASRVYVWRKLKKLGAVILHDAIWVLPNSPRTLEQFQWLAAEIVELEGEALLWVSEQLITGQEEWLVQQFQAEVDEGYGGILKELDKKDADLAILSRRYQQLRKQDYFQSELEPRVRQALLEAQGGTKE